VRRTVLEPDELVVDIAFAPLAENAHGVYLKLGLRRVLTIAVTNVALVVKLDKDGSPRPTSRWAALLPPSSALLKRRLSLVGGPLTDERIEQAASLAAEAARPIDDVRGSAWFRTEEVAALVRRGLQSLRAGDARLGLPRPEAMTPLWGRSRVRPRLSGPTVAHHTEGDEPIQCTVNGENVAVQGANGKTLLHMLRDDLGLVGTKAGCEEGECGSCTVWLDDVAVLSCLTPAPRAHGTNIVTIEGLSQGEELHPVQAAFVEADAAQCGYCTPGFVMSAANLLKECPNPTREQITTALSGNLCRCTGYYKIIHAVEKAAGLEKE
jgi:carbon-monoxide dehydrogenase medium subunit